MNRTGVFLSAAAALALVALVAGAPQLARPRADAPPPPPRPTSPGSLAMTARLSHPFIGPGQQDVFATVDLQAVEVPGRPRAPVNLALVLDRSGSMSGFKLNQARLAARQLIAQLTPDDRLSIVHYGSDVKAFDGVLATDENKARLLAFVDGIWDDGGTNIGAGLATGRDLLLAARGAFRVNRLVLISDGQPTEGIVEPEGLTGLVRELRGLGVSVSSIGVGDDFNEQLMSALAEAGAGAYAYLQDASQLAAIFQRDLAAAGAQVASGVSVTFRVPRGARLQRALGYSQVLRRFDADSELVTVVLPDFAAGQRERVVAHFTVEGGVAGAAVEVSDVALDYRDLLADGEGAAAARLSSMTTGEPRVVLEHRDKDAVVFAARARAGDNAARAAEAVARGDRAGAKRLLRLNATLFDEASEVAGAPAVQADRANQATLEQGVDAEPDARALQKRIHTQARRDFGLMGSTY